MNPVGAVMGKIRGRGRRAVDAAVAALFDAEYYLRQNQDVAESGINPYRHFCDIGWAEARNPNALFDLAWYYDRNPDIVAEGVNPLQHYVLVGASEGRRPHPLFDPAYYLDANPDVAQAGMEPLTHYVAAGGREGRPTHPLFDAAHYRRVAGLEGEADALGHFVIEGGAKGLSPHPLFDAKWYLDRNRDIRAAGANPLAHFVEQGWREGRAPHPLFDVEWYLDTYPDARDVAVDPLSHFISVGEAAGANPNPWFDGTWYLETHADVAAAGKLPFTHFVQAGAAERRAAGPNFQTDWYVQRYPEAGRPGVNPLRHFLEVGQAKGFAPTSYHLAKKAADKPTVMSASAKQSNAKVAPARPKINPRAGELIEPPTDQAGHALYPRLRYGDGRRLALLRESSDHVWYRDGRTARFLDGLTDAQLLPGVRRLLIIGHDFRMNTGVMRSLAHYLNALVQAGGVDVSSHELAAGADAMVALHDVEANDFTVVNSLPLFFGHPNGVELMRAVGTGKIAIYLHETDFVFDKLAREKPDEFAAFADAAREFNFLTVSAQQEAMLKERFGVTRMRRVYETSPLDIAKPPVARETIGAGDSVSIVMAGTLQPRKGVSLFSEVADLAVKEGLPWTFKWAGGEVGMSEGLYRSENVDFLGNLGPSDMSALLSESDLFFLSSVDDPFPLACLEALQMNKRCVVYRGAGTSEILRSVSGCAVYEQHDAATALGALKAALAAPLEADDLAAVNNRFGVSGFAEAFRAALVEWRREAAAKGAGAVETPVEAADAPRIAAIVHLFYHDLWDEIAGHLENVRHRNVDLFVTITTEKEEDDRAAMRARILKRWPSAQVIETPNRGMDVGPFVEVVRRIHAACKEYDLILKLHSKKSLAASGEAHGAAWRRDLMAGLAGGPTDVDRILSIFEDHDEIGMIGPKGFTLEKSSKDVAAGTDVNAPNMNLLADRMELSDRRQRFVRGTMFWARAKDLIEPIVAGDLTINDFEEGHQPDNSRGHAMERLFACMTRSAGRRLFEFDKDLPKPISLLRDRHKGEDVYIIAAGASAEYIDPKFFEGRTVIGVNRVFVRFPCTYTIAKEFAGADYERELFAAGPIPITAKWDSGNIRQGKMRRNLMSYKRPEYYFYDHLENTREVVDISVVEPSSDRLVVSYSTITSAMHLAAYMGAANIVLVGHDCGTLDGKVAFEGYYKDMTVSPWTDRQEYVDWLAKIEAQTVLVRDKLINEFGCRVVSINPFVNFGLEGHRYER